MRYLQSPLNFRNIHNHSKIFLKETVMKLTAFVALLLVVCGGCSPQQSEQLTQQQIDQIKNEVKVVVDSITLGTDVNVRMQYYWDSPEFLAFNLDGSQADRETVRRSHEWLDDSVVAIKLSLHDEYPVVTKDLVISVWHGTEELGLKSGDKVEYQPRVQTFVFRKLEGKWKIVYSHESGTFTREKSNKS